jgi:hypothetical protein
MSPLKFGAKCLLVLTLILLSFSVTSYWETDGATPTGPRVSYEQRVSVEPVEQGREAIVLRP